MKEEQMINALKAKVACLEEEKSLLLQELRWLRRKVFGSMSDRRAASPGEGPAHDDGAVQQGLFDEEYLRQYEAAHREAEEAAAEIGQAEERREAEIRRRRESAPRRRAAAKWDGLERRETVVEPEGVNPEEYVRIGEDVTERLRREPARFYVEVIRRPKYVLRSERGADSVRVFQAPAPSRAIGGNHAGAEVLAWVLVNKFQWSLPEHRQVAMLRQEGVTVSASTINDWVRACAEKLYVLYRRLKERILTRSDYVQADEVPFNVADRRERVRKGYCWQLNDCSGLRLGRVFVYDGGSRAQRVAVGLFKDFRGAVQVDGYHGYDFLEQQPGVTLLGCMAHVRRKFTDAEPEDKRASYPLDMINLLYGLERQLRERGASPGEARLERRAKAEPILEDLDRWMEMVQTQVTPKSYLGRAIDYTYKMMPRLRRYCLDGRYLIDNNRCESGNRASVLGRKNYLFCGNNDRAEDNAIFYSLIATCVDLGVDPLSWLTGVLAKPLLDMTKEELDALLPS